MKKYIYIILGTLILPVWLFAQTVVNVPSDIPPQEGNLNTAVQTAIDDGTLSSKVFMLEPFGYYVLTGTISVPAGQTLTIEAPAPGATQTEAPPQIVWTSTGGVNQQYNFEVFGNITLRNVWLRYANTSGSQVGSCLSISDDPNVTEQKGIFDGVIFNYGPCPQNISSGAVSIATSHFVGEFTNCYFKNMVDPHFRYYGRAISFPYNTTGWHINRVTFENCTFANMGYVFMQEGGEYSDNVKFNHCTFHNIVVFSLESGWWNKLSVNNCVFNNTYMFGDNPAQTGTGDPNGSTMRIDSVSGFGFGVPFTDQDRRILFTNNSYTLDQWLVDWMKDNPYSKQLHKDRRDDEIPVPMPMLSPGTRRFFDSVNASSSKEFPYMNRANLFDRTGESGEAPGDLGMILPPTDTAKVKIFMWKKWDDNTDTNWAWKPENDFASLWPLEENLSYTNAKLQTASLSGFPLGDLYHWWPEKYTEWKSMKTAEDTRIATWLETGADPGASAVRELTGVANRFELSQNYPNPFNPTTEIKYSVPKTGYVSLKVYNNLGQEVKTLFSGEQKSGNYSVTFDGNGLASGIYFYQLTSGSVSITKKFVLMK